MMLHAMIIFGIVSIIDAFIGYDCSGQNLNVTTISLLDTGDCSLDYKNTTSASVYVQLLQLSDYNYAEVIQCKIDVFRTIYYCGQFSHVSIVQNGIANYLHETSFENCDRLHKDGTFQLGRAHFNGIRPNTTSHHSATLEGEININGDCQGVHYIDPFGSWDKVAVPASVTISIRSSFVPVQLSTGKIMLRTGTTCPLKEGFCVDPDHGYTFWKPMPLSSCDFHQYDVLYEGPAIKTIGEEQPYPSPSVYSLVTHDTTFALTTTTEQHVCGYKLLRTEHPKLFILETTKNNVPKKQESVLVENLDIFSYVNSKFVYVEKHIKGQMISLYHNVIQQKCEMEKEVIKNTLSFAKTLPDEFAYRLMKKPGYMAVVAGEVVHVIKCIPVDVTIRKTKECFMELPVAIRNTSMFLTPRSRVITKYGTERECSHELPTMYNIDETWIQLTPEIQVRHTPPQQLQPLTKMTWSYLTPGPLAVSGIYSQRDIDKLRDHIMFPAEKPALLNYVARGIPGSVAGKGSVSMFDMMNEDTLSKIAHNTAQRMWSGFISFGSATAGILGIMIIIRLIKIVIDTVIHGYALHTVYGCSLHLLGAIWSSLTHLLLHLAHGPPKKKKDQGQQAEQQTDQPTAPLSVITDCPNFTQAQYFNDNCNNSPKINPYHNLLKSLQEENSEQNPPKPSDICSKKGREM